jgi:hypothetical protein
MFTTGKKVDQSFLIDDLNDLVQLHYDLVASYESALDDDSFSAVQSQLQPFIVAHRAQINALAGVIELNGGQPKSTGDTNEVAIKLRLAAGKLFSESGIYSAMKANEEKLMLEYERAINSLVAIPNMEAVMVGNYESARYRIMTLDNLLVCAKDMED